MSYIAPADLRAAGVPDPPTDAQLQALIDAMQLFIERITRNFFESRTMVLEMDGRGNTLLQLPHPIITLTNLFVNDDFVNPVPAESVSVYNGRGGTDRDDRRNPRIKIRTGDTSIFTGTGQITRQTLIFEVGEKNLRVEGDFGYTEPDGSIPPTIVHALTLLCLQNVDSLTVGGSSGFSGPIIEEETDRHRRKYADVVTGSKAWTTTGDPLIDKMLAAFRGPMSMSAPRTLFRRMTGGRIVG